MAILDPGGLDFIKDIPTSNINLDFIMVAIKSWAPAAQLWTGGLLIIFAILSILWLHRLYTREND